MQATLIGNCPRPFIDLPTEFFTFHFALLLEAASLQMTMALISGRTSLQMEAALGCFTGLLSAHSAGGTCRLSPSSVSQILCRRCSLQMTTALICYIGLLPSQSAAVFHSSVIIMDPGHAVLFAKGDDLDLLHQTVPVSLCTQ